MDDINCEIDRCPEPVVARGWCRTHYQRWYRHGDPLALCVMPETGGIYRINGPAGKTYIGSSENLRARWNKHKALLRKGDHHNASLQRLWDAFGEAAFTVSVLEDVADPALLIEAENRHLETATSNGGEVFNVSLDAGSPSRGMKHTDEARARMSASIKAAQTPEVLAGKRERVIGANNPLSKLDEQAVRTICERLLAGEHPRAVAESFGVSQETVYQIRSGKTWSHVVPAEMVAAMRAIRQNPWASGKRVVTQGMRDRFSEVGKSNKDRQLSAEHVAQMSARAQGQLNPRAKLTEEEIHEILLLIGDGWANKALAQQYGVSLNTIGRIRSGESWPHITGLPRVHGNTGQPKSPEHRAKLSASAQARWDAVERTPELSERMAELGRLGKGKVTSEETKRKMSEAQKGRPFTEEHLANLRAAKANGGKPLKLTAGDIPPIRARIAAREPMPSIAADYGVKTASISDIKHGRSWRHVP
jgi:group I intron endonuclease